jgi:hypothetical protein
VILSQARPHFLQGDDAAGGQDHPPGASAPP